MMFGFVMGAATVLGVRMIARRRRRWRSHRCGARFGHSGDWHEHHHGQHRGDGGEGDAGGGRERWWLGGLFGVMRDLQLTPDQKSVVRTELDNLAAAFKSHRPEWTATRADVAEAMRSEDFDETAMGDLFGRHDERLAEVRKAATAALGRIHGVLDVTQRERLATLLARERR